MLRTQKVNHVDFYASVATAQTRTLARMVQHATKDPVGLVLGDGEESRLELADGVVVRLDHLLVLNTHARRNEG